MKKLLFITLISLITSNAFAMPNPASKNCVDKGGKLEIVTEKNGGQVGMCHLPNGVVCEEFALLRNECRATPERARAGGYNLVSVNEPDVQKAAQFAVQQITQGKAKLRQVVFAKRQVVAGLNYDMGIQLNNGQRYKVIVYRGLSPNSLRLVSAVKL